MRKRLLTGALLLVLTALVGPAGAQQQPDPESPRYKGVLALQEFFQSEGEDALQAFADNHIAASYREELGDGLIGHLTELREMFAGQDSRGARPTGPLGATLTFPDNKSVSFTLDSDDPSRFSSITTGS